MTAPPAWRTRSTSTSDLDGTVIAGGYVEIESPHRLSRAAHWPGRRRGFGCPIRSVSATRSWRSWSPGVVAVIRPVSPSARAARLNAPLVTSVRVGGVDQLVDQDGTDLERVGEHGRHEDFGATRADASTFQHSPITRLRRARPFWEGHPQETAISFGSGEPIAAKRGRRRSVTASSHCSRVNDGVWGPGSSVEGFMPSIAAAYVEGVRCQGSPKATAEPLGLDRRSAPRNVSVGAGANGRSLVLRETMSRGEVGEYPHRSIRRDVNPALTSRR